ncbi:hypothetical protein BT93_H0681 [Corymbia citriodora subsp. variegata]|nr:hypothetical protein BT93_H0681 [Corymbia citriodora subsp. variegata]
MWCCGATRTAALGAPDGSVRVRVGRRGDAPIKFDVEATHLNHPLFDELLRSSEEEFGFSYDGALRIACEVDAFRCLLRLLDESRRDASADSADDGRSEHSSPSR